MDIVEILPHVTPFDRRIALSTARNCCLPNKEHDLSLGLQNRSGYPIHPLKKQPLTTIDSLVVLSPVRYKMVKYKIYFTNFVCDSFDSFIHKFLF